MRYLMLALVFIWVPSAAAAQSSALDRGSILVGGTAGFVSTGGDDEESRHTSLTVRPGVRYFLIPRLALGGEVLIAYSAAEAPADAGPTAGEEFTSSTFGVGPAVDYYFGDLDADLHPFVSGTAFLSWNRNSFAGEDARARGTVLRGAAGLLYLFSDQVGLNSALFYEWANQDVEDRSFEQNRFGLSFGISAFVF